MRSDAPMRSHRFAMLVLVCIVGCDVADRKVSVGDGDAGTSGASGATAVSSRGSSSGGSSSTETGSGGANAMGGTASSGGANSTGSTASSGGTAASGGMATGGAVTAFTMGGTTTRTNVATTQAGGTTTSIGGTTSISTTNVGNQVRCRGRIATVASGSVGAIRVVEQQLFRMQRTCSRGTPSPICVSNGAIAP